MYNKLFKYTNTYLELGEVSEIPRELISKFQVEFLTVLDAEGNVDKTQMPHVSEDFVKKMYHLMVLTRTFDEKLFKLQRSGKIGTYAQIKGEEASEIGSGLALEKDDWMVPSFRELGVFIARDLDKVKLVQAWNGDTRAFKGIEKTKNLPVAIPVCSQLLHAVGLAWAEKIKGTNNAVMVYFGDGATSEGDFHEALNFAGAHSLPIVFFCQNNQWAISTPFEKQTGSKTVAQKAIAYGMEGLRVDGNDVLATYKAADDALKKARKGDGPTLIESMTYRLGDHTTSDDSKKYRTDEEVAKWSKKDPLLRIQKYFEQIGTWNEEYKKWVKDECVKEVKQAVDEALAIEAPNPLNMFDTVYSELTPDLEKQKKYLEAELERRGGK